MAFPIKRIFACILLLNFVSRAKSSVKIWKHAVDIHNSTNWIGGGVQTRCDGFELGENAFLVLDDLNVTKIIFTSDGRFALSDDSSIEFNEQGENLMDCVQLKAASVVQSWSDPAAWIEEGDEDNVAIPHHERTPCKHDDVVFPNKFKSGVCLVFDKVRIKSFRFGNDYLTNQDLWNNKNFEYYLFLTRPRSYIDILGRSCTDTTGCICRESDATEVYCMFTDDIVDFGCTDPIRPIGFCTGMCGARILLRPKNNFRIADVRESLKRYSSDTYVSKVRDGDAEVIQIIFAEKEFSGSSLDEAREYFSRLREDEAAYAVALESSGPVFVEGEAARNALSMVFGTLCGVVLVFAILFFIYSPQYAALNLGNRFFLSTGSLSSFKGNLFARFDNTENAELILETHSLAGSVVNLDRSFHNPLFGQCSTPTTASTSYGSVRPAAGERSTKSEISLENPMYEVNPDEIVEEALEEDDADLIQSEE